MPERPPIPLELVLSGRDLTEPRPSPDGRHVAFVARWRANAAILRVPAEGGPERLVTTAPDPSPGRGLGGGCFDWLASGDGVVYGAVDGELWIAPVDAAPPERLTDAQRTANAPCVSPDGSFVVYVLDQAEVWSIDLGDRTVSRLDDGGDAFCFDPAISPDGERVSWQAWSPPDMPWDGAHRVTVHRRAGPTSAERWRPSGGAVQQPRFAPDGIATCVHDGTGWLNVSVGDHVLDEHFEHAGPSWGQGQRSFAVAPDGASVAFSRNERGVGALCVADLRSGSVRTVARGVHGQLAWRDDAITALRTGARTPTRIVRYDATTWARTTLAVGPALAWDAVELPEPELVEAAAADGLPLHARRYAAGEGRLLCWVHGGPTDQWQVDFRPRIAYWWSRGWDVLVVDPRGTTGHGRAHQQALNGGWGRLDVDDTATLVRHAHGARWSNAASTVVIGGSSGGLTALGLLADHAGLFAGGVVSYPVSDLRALAASTHRFEAHYTDTLVGHDDSRFDVLSPITRAERIAGPLLLFHGADDPVVPIAQSEALVERIRRGGGDVEYVVYDGEGHGFRDPEHQRDEYARTERFLARVS